MTAIIYEFRDYISKRNIERAHQELANANDIAKAAFPSHYHDTSPSEMNPDKAPA